MSTQKVALITGGNKGLGKEIARQLGAQGYAIVIGARDERLGRQAVDELTKGGVKEVRAVRLEVTNPEHIAAAVKLVADTFGHLDVLVNNAGISLDWDGTPMTAEKFTKTFNVNVTGQWLVTEAFVPLLAKSADARVINHSSMLGSIATCETSWDQVGSFATEAYATSKAALNMLTVLQSKKLAAKGIAVTAAHPGWVKTDLGTDAAPMDVASGAKTAVGLATMARERFPHGALTHLGDRLPW
ncbi:MAG: SDR family oxidoreductase [Deltaproteobacteria bacterium]|nr:SDR family oxidoreductase [Deltaproteobacteria bacterium]